MGQISRHQNLLEEKISKENILLHRIYLSLQCTVGVISQNVTHFLYCKIHTCRVGVWPIWVGPSHSTLGQPTPYTSSLRHPKMSYFQLVLLKIQQFEFWRGQFCFILVLFGRLKKCNNLPFQNYSPKIVHF